MRSSCRRLASVEPQKQKLLDSEKRFEAIFQGALDCVILKDTNLKYTHVNPATLELTRKPLSTFIGKTFEEVFGSDRADSVRAADQKTLTGETVETEFSTKISDRLITFSSVRFPIRDREGSCGRNMCNSSGYNREKSSGQKEGSVPIQIICRRFFRTLCVSWR